MLNPSNLYNYQRECILHMLYNTNAMCWLQMGLGKTIITLTAIVDLTRASKVKKTLIFGPIRVIESVWGKEAANWSHTNHLKFSIIRGNESNRVKAFNADADIYLINYEQMNWLAGHLTKHYINKDKPFPFQCVVYDEISKLKKSTSLRMKGGTRDRLNKKVKIIGWKKMIEHFTYRYGLTGTPVPNGYLDLFGQFLALDNGERLGTHITHFKNKYFNSDYNGWNFTIRDDQHKNMIEDKIKDITKKMDANDYLDLPGAIVTNIEVKLPSTVKQYYKELENKMFTELASGTEIELSSASSKTNKCLQLCNGSVYTGDDSKTWEAVHDVKLSALEDVLEEAAGSPVLCAYSYKSDAKRIMKHFKKYKPINLTEEKTKNTASIIDKWNNGKVKLLIGHPASMGHGIDGLQKNGSILVWFGLNWSLELYEQMNGRLDRLGQVKPVSIIRILCEDTVDFAIVDSLENKNREQDCLKNAINEYRRSKISFL